MSVAYAPRQETIHEVERRAAVPTIWLIFALGAALRLWGLTAQSLTMDEVFELGLVADPIRTIVAFPDGFPPLYHLIGHAWQGVVSASWGLRALSVIFGLLTIVVVWQLGRHAAGERVGLVAALFLAISPLHVWYSQEGRGYALYFLLASATIWLFYRALDGNRPREWIPYVATAALAGYTHYYSALLVIALLVTAVADPRGRERFGHMARAHLALAILMIPAVWLLQGDLRLQQSIELVRPPADFVAAGYAAFTFLAGFSVGPSLRELHTIAPAQAIREALPWAVVLGSATLHSTVVVLRDEAARSWAWRLGTLVVLPLTLAILAADHAGVGFRVRYVAWCAAPLLILVAIGIARREIRWGAALAGAGLLIVSGIALASRQLSPRYQNEDVHSAATFLESASQPNRAIFVMSGFMTAPLKQYLGESRSVTPLYGVARGEDTSALLRQIEDTTVLGQPFWLVYTRAFDGDPQGTLLDSLKARAGLTLRVVLAGVEIFEGRGY